MRITQKAFSIVELAVVIAVLGVLATITAVGYTKLQRDARDTERSSDIAIIQSALETYYEKNGSYPYPTQIMTQSFLRNTLSLPSSAIIAPDATTTSSLVGSTGPSTGLPSTSQYFYSAQSTINPMCGVIISITYRCDRYTLTWRQETDNSVQSVQSKYGW